VFTRYLRPALSLLLGMTVITGMIYPLIITGASSVAFASKGQGSLLRRNAVLIGSHLIGQNFTDPKHFWGRPSATAPQPYNGASSGGSNLGPLNPALLAKVKSNAKALHDADPANTAEIPVELVTASASGLDPDISPAAANYQAARVARARQLPIATVRSMIAAHQQAALLGVFGEPRINVLELNLALDQHH
jgi:K+-transporting ATPase ATPase C chain